MIWVCISARASVGASVGSWASVCRSGWSNIVVLAQFSSSVVAPVTPGSSELRVEPLTMAREQSRGYNSIQRWALDPSFRGMVSGRKTLRGEKELSASWSGKSVLLLVFLLSRVLISTFPHALCERKSAPSVFALMMQSCWAGVRSVSSRLCVWDRSSCNLSALCSLAVIFSSSSSSSLSSLICFVAYSPSLISNWADWALA